MKIWYVDTDDEFSCAWTKKSDAISYFKNLIHDSELFYLLIEGKEDDDYNMIYSISDTFLDCTSNDCENFVEIYAIYLDEKPYVDGFKPY